MVPVKLDVVVKVKAREEERKLEALSASRQRVEAARQALRDARARADAELTGGGRAADFCVHESARARSLELVKQAQAKLDAAVEAETAARAAWMAARSQADAVRRVADARRAELLRESEARERKSADELTLLRFARAG
jgi:flagellar biosynthesis chaperone FliJ